MNKTRNIVAAAFNDAMKESPFALTADPALDADVRREAHRGVLYYYSPAEIEQIADGMAAGVRREAGRERDVRQIALDRQDGKLVRVAVYIGLRLGELLALRWRDVDLRSSVLPVSRAMSAGVETTTKSGRVRRVPLPQQAIDAWHACVSASTSPVLRSTCSPTRRSGARPTR